MNTPTIAEVAAAWWRKAVEQPKFDAMGRQEDDSFAARDDILTNFGDRNKSRRTMEMGSLLAMMCVKPTTDEAFAKFETVLADDIASQKPRTLGVDYGPDRILSVCAEQAGVDTMRFPWKTMMWLDWTTGHVRVGHGYRAPIQEIRAADIVEPPTPETDK